MLGALGISMRIYFGFGIVLLLLGALAGSTFLSIQALDETFTAYRATARDSLFVGDKVRALGDTRVARLSFAAEHDKASHDAVITGLDVIASAAAEAETRFEDPALASLARSTGGLAQDYRLAFVEQAAAMEQGEALKAAFQKQGNVIYQALADLADEAAAAGDHRTAQAAAFLNLQVFRSRIRSTIFMATNDPKELDLALERLGFVKQALAEMMQVINGPRLLAMAEAVVPALGQFETYTNEMRDILGKIDETDHKLNDEIGPKLSAAYAELLSRISTVQNRLGPEAAAKMDQSRTTALAIGGGAMVLGLVLAVVIGRWIAGAVERMAGSMSRMAEGNLDIEITGDGYRHELGAMARALKVFQANGREKLRLDGEARASAERDAAAAREREALQTAVAGVVDKAAAGDFAARVEARFKDDALNAFARQLNALIEAVSLGVGETAKVMAALAQGNLTATMQGEFRGAFAELQRNVNATVTRLSSTVVEIQEVGGSVSTATSQIAEGSQNLSGRAENQAASLEEIAATMEEMSATVKTNAENAYAASNLSAEASSRADKGGTIVAEAVTAMASIEEGSRKIADIVTVIDGFAFQTNLLALNAAVEAARAGEAGKGFAVVASEVRTLAQRSAEAARDIKTLIQESSHQVSDGVRLVEETGVALKEIVEAIRKVSETITEISEASREQSSGVDEITAAITSMDEITQQNSALADESASAAKGLTDQAARLMDLMRFFTVSHRAASGGNAWDADAAADRMSAARSTFAAE